MLGRIFRRNIPSFFHQHKLATMKSTYTVLADDSAIEKPLLDDRSYRFVKLESNNMHVLLITDPTTDRSAASLDVNVGSFADKKYGVPGLAHFCEHLLFMGTEKYPEENEYLSYLSKHLGYSNAYTAAEHTNYYFEVGSENLEGALDRFAQFFISPLFSQSCKDREIKAVDSENKKNLQNDTWRMYQLDKLTSNPDHPYNGFSTGNYETLHEEPVSRGLNVRDVLLDFYKEQYSSNIMSLVVLGKESLDELTEWAITKFSDVPDNELARPSYNNEVIYTPEQVGKLTLAKPIMDSHKLELTFQIPDDQERNWECRPAGYFAHLLGHESEGSVLRYLQKKNWVNELSAGNMKVCQGTSLFMIELELTPLGLENWKKIVVHVFEYLNMVRAEGPQKWLWKEISDMSKINFRFKQKLGTSSTVSKMSNTLYKFTEDFYVPPEHLLNSHIVSEFNPEEINKYASYLIPANFRLSLTSQKLDGLTSTEKWYGTEYLFDDIPEDLLQLINAISPNDGLHLPVLNKFIPEDFTVKGEKSETPSAHPYLITDTAKFETWFKQDDQFRIPKGSINIVVHAPALSNSIETAVLGMLLSELIDDDLNEIKYYASIVGLSFSIQQFRDSYSLKVSGYNDKLPVFLSQILEKFVVFKPKKDRFESIKFKITQDLKNFGFETPYSQIGTHFLQLINEKTYTDSAKLQVIKDINFEDVLEFATNKLWTEGVFIQSLIHGNFAYSTAVEVSDVIEKSFKEKKQIADTSAEVDAVVKFQSYSLKVGERTRYELPLQDADNVNSCLEYFIQVGLLGEENTRLRVLTDLLGTMIHEPCFNQLRTKEQLGYVVFSGYRQSRSYFGLRVLVQSERPCDYLEYRVEKFLEKFQAKNLGAELTEENFSKFKQSLKNKKLAKLKNLGEETARFWNAINDGYYDFTQKAKDVEILDTVTKDEFLGFFNDYFVAGAPKSARLTVYLKSQKSPSFDEAKLFTSAVHNYIYQHEVPISTEVVDGIIEAKGLDLAVVSEEVLKEISDKEAAAQFKENFVAEVTERVHTPTPEVYPKGDLVTLSEDFKETHSKGGAPVPVEPLPTFYYRQGEEAHL